MLILILTKEKFDLQLKKAELPLVIQPFLIVDQNYT